MGKLVKNMHIRLKKGIHKPQRQYPINKKGLDELNKTIKELEEQGTIQEVKGAITSHPIQLVPKRDGTFGDQF